MVKFWNRDDSRGGLNFYEWKVWGFVGNCVFWHCERLNDLKIMAKPIEPTPVLKGDDAY